MLTPVRTKVTGVRWLPVGRPATALQWFSRGERRRTSGTIASVHLILVAVVLSAEMLGSCLPSMLEIGGEYEVWRGSVHRCRDVTDVS